LESDFDFVSVFDASGAAAVFVDKTEAEASANARSRRGATLRNGGEPIMAPV
jgi:hypothetical protein